MRQKSSVPQAVSFVSQVLKRHTIINKSANGVQTLAKALVDDHAFASKISEAEFTARRGDAADT
ncbi:MAG: hypothetical protein WB677_15730 [Xanthobacteraceae bacterium]